MSTNIIDLPARSRVPADDAVAKIGPNAVIQLVAALRDRGLEQKLAPAFVASGVHGWLDSPPGEMVDAARVGRLYRAVRANLSPALDAALMREAGRRTAEYLLRARIPRPVQMLLKILPARLAAMSLLAAIRAHAWTFAGAARFSARSGKFAVMEMRENPLCVPDSAAHPACFWHEAVFQRLFEVLVSPQARVVETACEAAGDSCCRFMVTWTRSKRPRPSHGKAVTRSSLLSVMKEKSSVSGTQEAKRTLFQS
jgi:divinyl protochlorophyllide a 8-vinyl-reductase